MSEVATAVLPSTNVYGLGKFVANYSLTPREAVRNAYAQFEKKDYNTWDYAKYDSLVVEGEFTFSCGSYVAFKDSVGRQSDGSVPQVFSDKLT